MHFKNTILSTRTSSSSRIFGFRTSARAGNKENVRIELESSKWDETWEPRLTDRDSVHTVSETDLYVLYVLDQFCHHSQ